VNVERQVGATTREGGLHLVHRDYYSPPQATAVAQIVFTQEGRERNRVDAPVFFDAIGSGQHAVRQPAVAGADVEDAQPLAAEQVEVPVEEIEFVDRIE
jgi:hypothetical protein